MSTCRSCPRCGGRGFETLKTYAHCVHCLYFEDYYEDSESMYHKSLGSLKAMIPYLVDEIEPDEVDPGEKVVSENSSDDESDEEDGMPIGA